ncbi:MAG TPA: hypothetical protein ENH23_01015 [candidate division Zixibacteria bacterium]|nr:hypothetical protein [candidate division Zixibacteria bacterium]
MKMVFMYFFEGKTDEVMDLLKSEKIENYVRWDEIKGQSAGYRPRMGTDVWPGNNSAVQFPVEDDRMEELCGIVTKFNEEAEYEGISMFAFDITCMVVKELQKE